MHLALVIDDYLPHSTRVGAKMFHELAKQFVAMGHRVTVITPDVTQQQRLTESDFDGITIWRFRSGEIKNVGKVKRAINETLLSRNAWRAIKSRVSEDTFDAVVYYSPSIFFGSLVKSIKHRCKCSSYLVLRDLFPQWVIDAGMIRKGSLIERYFRYFECKSYAQATTIGLMSAKNVQVFDQMVDQTYPTQVLRNWAALTPHKEPTVDFRESLGLIGKVVFFYGGNIGKAQDMANLLRLAKSMSGIEQAHFLFVGQGDEVELINNLANKWQLNNFTYLPSVNQSEFKDLLLCADVGLFSLSKSHTAHNFPGKLLGYMVQSVPILGSVNDGNDLMGLVNQTKAGKITINGDDELLFENAKSMLSNEVREQMGHNGYQLLCKEFSVQSIAQSIIDSFHVN